MSKYYKHQCCQNNILNDNDNCDDDIIEASSPCTNMPEEPKYNCDCGFDMDTDSVFPNNPMLAQSYVPIQRMKKVFTPEVGLKMGTIFPELVSPYCPGQSIREIEYLRKTNSIGEGCNK